MQGDQPRGDAASVPLGMRTAAAWSWRFLAVAGLAVVLARAIALVPVVIVPVLVAVLLCALITPLRLRLEHLRVPHAIAVLLCLLLLVLGTAALIALVVVTARAGFAGVSDRTVRAAEEVEAWLRRPPLSLSDVQLSDAATHAVAWAQAQAGTIASGAVAVGSTVAEVLAGILLTLFTLLFLLLDGGRIVEWTLRLLPRRARLSVRIGARAGWRTLSSFVRAQVAVAGINGVGIGIGALALQLPLALPIAIIVFLGSFVPLLGALVTGLAAALVAALYGGWVAGLVMLAIVVVVHQVEGHVLQPLILGTAVKVHPLAVVLGVAAGFELAGIAGAMFAVPTIATANAMISTIARHAGSGSRAPVEGSVAAT